MESELIVFLVYVACLIIYVRRKYDSRMFVGTAIFLLVECAILLAMGYGYYANELAIIAYYFLVDGVAGLFINYLRKEKKSQG